MKKVFDGIMRARDFIRDYSASIGGFCLFATLENLLASLAVMALCYFAGKIGGRMLAGDDEDEVMETSVWLIRSSLMLNSAAALQTTFHKPIFSTAFALLALAVMYPPPGEDSSSARN